MVRLGVARKSSEDTNNRLIMTKHAAMIGLTSEGRMKTPLVAELSSLILWKIIAEEEGDFSDLTERHYQRRKQLEILGIAQS